jgi:SAM-dependent methyltransferase
MEATANPFNSVARVGVANDPLLKEISAFCRSADMAESTFGRRAVNDGKFVARLRFGGRVTTSTVERVRDFIRTYAPGPARAMTAKPLVSDALAPILTVFGTNQQPNEEKFRSMVSAKSAATTPAQLVSRLANSQPLADAPGTKDFRFYDNRQKYLLFVNTCAEKWVASQRIDMELAAITPHAPAFRLFDAGVGDGTVLSRVMRSMHDRMPTVPFYVVGKEISLEDVRLALEKMPDRFCEHPSTVLVMTNMFYGEAPWLHPRSLAAASALEWHEVALKGSTSGSFEKQIAELQPFLAAHWHTKQGKNEGLAYERPMVLVLYREDHKILLDGIRPRQGGAKADFDLVIASQPYRANAPIEFKASKVIAPLARALGPGGRLIGFHSHGNDPGMEIVRKIWPTEDPFAGSDRHVLLKATKQALGVDARGLNFNTYSDKRSLFTYDMHTLPTEISSSIGTSTLMAAWNAAVYVAQIDDQRLAAAMGDSRYLEATREVLQRHGKLWFENESFCIWRDRP